MSRFKTGELYTVEIKLSRNPAFHRKVFQFFNFCFQYWSGPMAIVDESEQFDVFRKNLTVLAGYYMELVTIKGDVRIEAKSISYSGMDQEEFEKFYNSLITAALKHIFGDADEDMYNKLMSFF